MGDKVAVEETSVRSHAKPTFWARVKAHFKKWWWVHLIILIVVVLVVTLPVVYVGYPNIAQGDINDSTLSVKSMEITNPAPNGFHLKQRQVIGSHSIFDPTIFSFDAAVSLLGSAVFATVRVPQVKGVDGAEVLVDQWVNLTNPEAFADFSTAVMMNEEFNLNIYGEPKLQQGALPKIDIDYNKTVTMKGLNKLHGFEIQSLRLEMDRDDGNNAVGTVFIPNPSVLRLSMGNLTMDVSAGNGTSVGQTFLHNLVLEPGNNTVPMLSALDTDLLLNFVAEIGSTIPLTIVGNSSVYNGEEIPYFSAALAANKLTTNLDIAAALSA